MSGERHSLATPIEALFERWVERHVAHGERLDPVELCRDRPELLEPLREQIRKYDRLDQLIDPPPSLAIDQTLLHYRIVNRLGAGGMGEVFVADDTKLGRQVALKVLPPEMASDEHRLERFRREARIVAALNHPNIVTLFSVEQAGDLHFLTMELVGGETLEAQTPAEGLEPARILLVARELAAALEAAHEQGIIHRDLKPANVMIGATGSAKVLDFGLAKLVSPHASRVAEGSTDLMVTEAGRVLGTVAYMSPEQARGEALDARTDIFSLGVILYELATGRRPFAGDTTAEALGALLEREPPSPSSVNPRVPRQLDRIILKCLRKERDQRYPSARDLGADLDRLERSPWRRRLAPAAALSALALALRLAVPLERSPRDERIAGSPRPADSARRAAPVSLAVLPFADLSPNKDQEYFTDGLTEELMSVLTRVEGLRVAARVSSFAFKGETPKIAEVGSRLDVSAILEGSVRKADRRIRITAQLVDVDDGFHLWSQTYERRLDDIFAVQADIARSVAAALEVALDLGDAKASASTSADAYTAYLQGRYFVTRFTEENLNRALGYFHQALALDGDYAPAWAALADLYFHLAGTFGSVPLAAGMTDARRAAERALELDEGSAAAHAVLGRVRMSFDWDWSAAEASLGRALELEPHNAAVLLDASILALTIGDVDQALALNRRAIELDPLNPLAHQRLVRPAGLAGLPDEATAALDRALALAPEQAFAHFARGALLLLQSRPEEALGEMRKEPRPAYRLFGLALAHYDLGHLLEADATLAELIERFGAEAAYQIAEVYAYRGEAELAFEWLDRAYAQRDGGLAWWLKTDPFLAGLEDDPRYLALLAKLGLAD